MRISAYITCFYLLTICLFSSCASNDQKSQDKSKLLDIQESNLKKNIQLLNFKIVKVETGSNNNPSSSEVETLVTIEAMMKCSDKLVEDIKYEYSENKKAHTLSIFVSAFSKTKFSLKKDAADCLGDVAVTRVLRVLANESYKKENITLINQKKINPPKIINPNEPSPNPNPSPNNEEADSFAGNIDEATFDRRNKKLLLTMSYEKGCTQQRFAINYWRSGCLVLSGTNSSICEADLIHYRSLDSTCNASITNQTNEISLEAKLAEIGRHTLNIHYKNKLGLKKTIPITVQ